jgi:ligand-binding sensor domain-containing protein
VKKIGFNSIILLTCSLHIVLTCRAQDFASVTLTKYTQNEGLSSYFITKIIQDTNGFLWIGTQEGVNLFDGKTFLVFSNDSKPNQRLGAMFVADMVEDKTRGLIWVLTSYGDVCGIDIHTRTVTHRITHDPTQTPLTDTWLRSIQLHNNILWLGGQNALYGFDINHKKYIDFDFRKQAGVAEGEYNISKVVFDTAGNMWIASEGYGLVILDRNRAYKTAFTDILANDTKQRRKLLFLDILTRDNRLYVGTSWGLRTFEVSPDKIRYIPDAERSTIGQSEIISMAFAPDNALLLSIPGHFYALNLVSKKYREFRTASIDENMFLFIYQIYYDSLSDVIWIGTQSGLAFFSPHAQPFDAYSKSSADATRLKHLYSLAAVSDTEVYGGDENGIYHINLSSGEIERIDTASANYMLFEDRHKNLFVSNKSGFKIIRGRKTVDAHTVFPELRPLESDHLSRGLQYNDSLILFASIIQKGLSVWNTKAHTLVTFHQDSMQYKIEGLSVINLICPGPDKDILILTEKSIIGFNPITAAYTFKKIQSPGEGEPPNNFMDICKIDNGYCIATYGKGLLQTDNNFNIVKTYTTTTGLSNNGVYRVFAAGGHRVIATTNKGLAVVNTQDASINNYFQRDGLHGNGFEQLCGDARNDKIYVGGVDGFTRVDPIKFRQNSRPPRVYLSDIRIESASGAKDTCNLRLSEIIAPNDVHQTTVYFSGLNYANPTRVQFYYKIKELGDGWINLGNRNFINLIGLSPGTYTLQVVAANENGVKNTEPLTLSMVYLPKWFQTRWFQILAVLAGAGAIYILYAYRIAQINKQQQIRKEIANDLHDDIGSTLNTLKIFTHMARKEPGHAHHLENIEQSVANATLGLRDIIWVLDDTQDSAFELMTRIRKIWLPVCLVNDIEFESSVKSDVPDNDVSKTEKRNLLLIAKEAVNNSIKYAHCKKISVTFYRDKRQTRFTVHDDGAGFALDTITPGKGLRSMQYRATQIGYTIDIQSSPAGTRVELVRKATRRAF